MQSGTRVSTQSTPVSALRPLRFQTAHAQRNPREYSEYPCEYSEYTGPIVSAHHCHLSTEVELARSSRGCWWPL